MKTIKKIKIFDTERNIMNHLNNNKIKSYFY